MENKYKVKVVSHFEFPSREDAEAFSDFKRFSEADVPECTSIEIEKLYENPA